jgi:hypothetical protein
MSSIAKRTLRLVVATSTLAATVALIAPTPASATEECIAATTHGHGIDPPDEGDCVYMRVYTAVDGRIVVQYSGNQDYDFYQLRWSRPGRAESQSRVRGSGAGGSWWALNNAWRNTPYTFKVQACYSGVFGSDCTYWTTDIHFK